MCLGLLALVTLLCGVAAPVSPRAGAALVVAAASAGCLAAGLKSEYLGIVPCVLTKTACPINELVPGALDTARLLDRPIAALVVAASCAALVALGVGPKTLVTTLAATYFVTDFLIAINHWWMDNYDTSSSGFVHHSHVAAHGFGSMGASTAGEASPSARLRAPLAAEALPPALQACWTRTRVSRLRTVAARPVLPVAGPALRAIRAIPATTPTPSLPRRACWAAHRSCWAAHRSCWALPRSCLQACRPCWAAGPPPSSWPPCSTAAWASSQPPGWRTRTRTCGTARRGLCADCRTRAC